MSPECQNRRIIKLPLSLGVVVEADDRELGPVAGLDPPPFGRYLRPITGVWDKSNVKSIVRPGSSYKLQHRSSSRCARSRKCVTRVMYRHATVKYMKSVDDAGCPHHLFPVQVRVEHGRGVRVPVGRHHQRGAPRHHQL